MEGPLFLVVLVAMVGGIVLLTRRPSSASITADERAARRIERARDASASRRVAVLSSDKKLVDMIAFGLAPYRVDVEQRVDVEDVGALDAPDAIVLEAEGLSRDGLEVLADVRAHASLTEAMVVLIAKGRDIEADAADMIATRKETQRITEALIDKIPLAKKRP